MSAKVAAYSVSGDSTILVLDSFGHVCVSSDPCELLDFLIHSCTTRVPASTLRVLWNLDKEVSCILSLLLESVQASLASSLHRAFYDSYKLFYIPGKVFAVTRSGGNEARFYDLSQYFPQDPEPSGMEALQQKADLLMATLSGAGIQSPKTLSSPVAIAEASGLLDVTSSIPTIFDAPENSWDAYELALQCTPREWVSNYRVGHWESGKLWSVDLASAYGAAASRLPDLRDCSFSRSDVMDDSALYGVLVGRFTVYPDSQYAFCSPFLENRGDGVLVNFIGTRENYPCLLDEVRTLYQYKLGEFHLDHGWFFGPLHGVQPRRPFHQIMSKFYQSRSQSPTASFFFKRVMNGMIGKLLETRRNDKGEVTAYGDLFNPLYHSLITTATRLRVFEFLVQHGISQEELVHIGVDGIKLTRHIPLPVNVEMGQWRSTGSQPTFVLSPGAVITTARNYKQTGYAELVEQITALPTESKYGVHGNIDLGKLAVNQIRIFPDLPKTGQALMTNTCQSHPVML